jgi:hypothetical protein
MRSRTSEQWTDLLCECTDGIAQELTVRYARTHEVTLDEFANVVSFVLDNALAKEDGTREREWVGSMCGGRQPADPGEEREDGTTQPCEECEDEDCEAELETVE